MAMCYPDTTDWGCLSPVEQGQLDSDTKGRAEFLAWMTLQRLLGYRLSLCPVVWRPCARRVLPMVGEFQPYILNGTWYNACGCSDLDGCGCSSATSVRIPGEVSGPVTVKINDGVLAQSAYRIDNGSILVRTDGGTWPLSQDITSASGFSISYYPGIGPDDALSYAAGLLALEWYKACQGMDCRLPAGVTTVARQGINFTIPSGVFDGGLSGIREVDAITGIYNPHRLKVPTRVMSPDRLRGRTRTA